MLLCFKRVYSLCSFMNEFVMEGKNKKNKRRNEKRNEQNNIII